MPASPLRATCSQSIWLKILVHLTISIKSPLPMARKGMNWGGSWSQWWKGESHNEDREGWPQQQPDDGWEACETWNMGHDAWLADQHENNPMEVDQGNHNRQLGDEHANEWHWKPDRTSNAASSSSHPYPYAHSGPPLRPNRPPGLQFPPEMNGSMPQTPPAAVQSLVPPPPPPAHAKDGTFAKSKGKGVVPKTCTLLSLDHLPKPGHYNRGTQTIQCPTHTMVKAQMEHNLTLLDTADMCKAKDSYVRLCAQCSFQEPTVVTMPCMHLAICAQCLGQHQANKYYFCMVCEEPVQSTVSVVPAGFPSNVANNPNREQVLKDNPWVVASSKKELMARRFEKKASDYVQGHCPMML